MTDYKDAFLCKCKKCGFVFSVKIPSQKDLSSFYDGYGEYEYISPITIARYNELLDYFEKYRENNNLLDIGTGTGTFLIEAKKRGWDVYGTEYGEDKVKLGIQNGIKMADGVLSTLNYTVKFDVITSFEVIEHINNPCNEIENIKNLLRKGGVFYITTPNFNSLSRRYLKNKWQQIFYPEHLSYYSVKTLSKVLKDCSLIPIKAKTTGISLTVYKKSKGANISLGNSDDSDDEILRNKIETSFVLAIIKDLINSILSFFRLGDTIKIFAVKK
ncbi:class I SAM-dependent methyltransferase [Vicingus serpentipes]|nr:class I SAM-dependent methyltransferase [Vicingus serpentipes]